MRAAFEFALVALSFALFSGCSSGSSSSPSPAPLAPRVSNLGLAVESVIGKGELRMVVASEAGQGVDLNVDGDREDLVLHLLDLESGVLTNTGLALSRRFRRDPPDGVPPPEFLANDRLAVFQVSEADAGRDLDQDGIPDEVATWIFIRSTGALEPLSFAHTSLQLDGDLAVFLGASPVGPGSLHVFDGSDASLTTLPFQPSTLVGAGGGIVAFALPELGVADLNVDGDMDDSFVLHLYDHGTGRVRNTFFDMARSPVRIVDGFAGFLVSEVDGNLDLNADGDEEDIVFVAVSGHDGLTRIPGFGQIEFADFADADPEMFQLLVPEDDLDLNGDGDTDDRVALAYRPGADEVLATGLASQLFGGRIRSGRWLGLSVDELQQGALDLSGNGLVGDQVMHIHDLQTGTSVNLGLPGFFLAPLGEGLLGLTVDFNAGVLFEPELILWDARTGLVHRTGPDFRNALGSASDIALVTAREGARDLNGDGDTLDLVLALFQASTGEVLQLAIATRGEAYLAAGGRGTALVPESSQGTDLNGDGDLLDSVLFVLEL